MLFDLNACIPFKIYLIFHSADEMHFLNLVKFHIRISNIKHKKSNLNVKRRFRWSIVNQELLYNNTIKSCQ